MTGPQPFVFDESGEAKRYAPATERNRDAITSVLRTILPSSGIVLEIASGTGEHIVHFAQVFPALTWQPSDPDPAGLASIAAWREEAGLANLKPAVELDASVPWPVIYADAIVCINMVHISPWEATIGLLDGAAKILPENGILYLYGPYRRRGIPTVESNESFDLSLKSRDPAWGLRIVEDVVESAIAKGLQLFDVIEMPANNLSVIFRNHNSI